MRLYRVLSDTKVSHGEGNPHALPYLGVSSVCVDRRNAQSPPLYLDGSIQEPYDFCHTSFVNERVHPGDCFISQ